MIDLLALAIVGASAVVAVIAAVDTERLTAGVPMMLDLWLAAGLLRLAYTDSWPTIAGAAALIAIRKLVSHVLR